LWLGRKWGIAATLCVLAASGATVPALAGTVHHHAKAKPKAKPRPKAKTKPKSKSGPRGGTGASGPAGATGPAGTTWLRTVVVSPSASSPAGNGALLEAAVAPLGSEATAATPYLVWIEPGVYDVGATTLQIPADVDVQGSGQDNTTIQGEGTLTVNAANAELRELSVTDSIASGGASAIDTGGGLQDVTATATGGTGATAVLEAGATALVNVTATATTTALSGSAVALNAAQGVQVDGGTYDANTKVVSGQAAALFARGPVTVSDATLTASGSSANYSVFIDSSATTVTVTGSTLAGDGGFFVPLGATLDVGGSQVPSPGTVALGTVSCPDDWLASFDVSSSDCT
jgi:hypothetical protein